MKVQLVLFCILYSIVASAQDNFEKDYQKRYDENIQKEVLNGIYIPEDISDALLELDKLSSPEGRAKFIRGTEDLIAERLIFGLGKWIIVNWNFYEGSRLSHSLRKMGVTLPDDMAEFIMISYYRKLKGISLDLDKRATAIYEKRKKEQDERNQSKIKINGE